MQSDRISRGGWRVTGQFQLSSEFITACPLNFLNYDALWSSQANSSHKWENTDPLAVCFACKYLSKNYTKQKSKEEKYIYIYNKSVSQVLTFRFEPSLQIAIFRDQFELSCQGTLSLS